MVKKLVYQVIKYYCRFLIRFFFGKVEIIGREKIPNDQPVIYSSNHQNAFMDASKLVVDDKKRLCSELEKLIKVSDGDKSLIKSSFEKLKNLIKIN